MTSVARTRGSQGNVQAKIVSEILTQKSSLSLRKPKPISISRVSAFNETMVGKFFVILRDLLNKYNFEPGRIYNATLTRSNPSYPNGWLDLQASTFHRLRKVPRRRKTKKWNAFECRVCHANWEGTHLKQFKCGIYKEWGMWDMLSNLPHPTFQLAPQWSKFENLTAFWKIEILLWMQVILRTFLKERKSWHSY